MATKARTFNEAAVDALIPAERRAAHEARVAELVARNALLVEMERERERVGMSKTELAHRAGLEPSATRRLLNSDDPNPTTSTLLRMAAVLGIGLDLVRPDGDRVHVLAPHPPAALG